MALPTFLLIGLVCLSPIWSAEFQCPERKGFYPDREQCDLYYACVEGEPEQRLCKDGLVFRDDNPKKELCDIPANVPCGDRTLLLYNRIGNRQLSLISEYEKNCFQSVHNFKDQTGPQGPPWIHEEPQPTKDCPRANGYFKHEDETQCDKFVNCIDGVAQIMPCPPGLIYDDVASSCVWPQDTERVCSDVKRDVLDDGFVCPRTKLSDAYGRIIPHPTYPHPDDCAKFYICRNGLQPQKGQCENGTVYNEEIMKCMDPENVPGCEDYYKQ